MNTLFHVAGTHCDACAKVIALKLKKIPDVQSVDTSLVDAMVTIDASRPISQEEAQAALEGTSYILSSRAV